MNSQFSTLQDFEKMGPALERVYGQKAPRQMERCRQVLAGLEDTYGPAERFALFSAPGRTEIGGNHTDHQHGLVLAGSIDLDILAAVTPNGENVIRVRGDAFPMDAVKLSDLAPREEEKGTSAALIRGVAAWFADHGCALEGFNAYTVSSVLKGSGLSSSAAFEVLLGNILNELFNGGRCTPVELAKIGQYAENVYFGKPSGLLDQMACSVGGMVAMDFADTVSPVVERVNFDFASAGHTLCIIDSGADHADLTGEYAAVTRELRAVCAHFGKNVLREVPEADFWAALPEVRRECGDRAVLRAVHIYSENRRAEGEADALRRGDFAGFLQLVKASGLSSWRYLQNVTPAGYAAHQEVAVALALCETLLGKRGASRVHGGGFAGTVQAFVPMDMLEGFRTEIDRILGEGACHVLTIRPVGGVRLL